MKVFTLSRRSAAALALCAALGASVLGSQTAWAQSEASETALGLPIASVLAPASGMAASVTLVGALPAALSAGGATLVLKGVQASAAGVTLLLERVSDGAQASVEVAADVLETAGLAIGTALSVTTLASGAILEAGGEALMFIPNELGKALLHNEKLS